jgi:Cu+-exporting ATPase
VSPENSDESQQVLARTTAIDPVCGMEVDAATPKHSFQCGDEVFHFCSAGCRVNFVADPVKYNKRTQRNAPAASSGVIYTCPMHPQIRRNAPGNCPICGMTLEPLIITADSPPNQELTDMTRRFWFGLVLSLPVFLIEMGGHIPWLGVHRLVSPALVTWIEFVLSTPVVLWAGWPFFERAWASVVNRSLNMFSLIALGTGSAYAYSVIATVAPGIFPRVSEAWAARSRCTSKRPQSSRCSCSWAGS